MVGSSNKTVELVQLWGAFEAKFPNASLDDFFRYSLTPAPAAKEKIAAPGPGAGKLLPDINGRLIILLRRIGRFHMAYSNKALAGTDLGQIEEFGILVTIYNEGNPIKSEAIYNNIIELTSGSNMLARMKKRGLVEEFADAEDKRVKRLKVTEKGEQTLMVAKEYVLQVAHMMLQDLSDEDKLLCMQLLQPVDARFSGLVQKQKGSGFNEIYRENMQD